MTSPIPFDLCVIGGGPAGMTAAGRAAELGARVILLERNRQTGRKLLITGGGRCNVTNALADRHLLVSRYGPRAQPLHSPFARFTPDDTRSLFAGLGLGTVEEGEGRVFPVTQRAASVRDALVRYLRAGSVDVRTGVSVDRLEIVDGRVTVVVTGTGESIVAHRFLLATGGVSRPETGSTGDGFRWLAAAGIAIRVPEPSLVPVRVAEEWPVLLQGLALPNARVTAFMDGRRQFAATGKLLFTHFGLSGPVVLNLSQKINELAQGGTVFLQIDPFPDEDGGAVDRRLQQLLSASPRKNLGNVLGLLVPTRMARVLLSLAAVSADTSCSELTRVDRSRIVALAKALPVTFSGLLGTDHAVVSSGGVDPAEIDFTTMALRRIPNLAVAGDMLDFDRQSGGYSLQLCWSTGWVAGTAAGSDVATANHATGQSAHDSRGSDDHG